MITIDTVRTNGRISDEEAAQVVDLWTTAYPAMRQILDTVIRANRATDRPVVDVNRLVRVRRELGQMDRGTHRPCTQSPPGFSPWQAFRTVRAVADITSSGSPDAGAIYRLVAALADLTADMAASLRATPPPDPACPPPHPNWRNPPMTPAEELRTAATTLRKLAAAATPGPWHRPLNTRYKSAVTAALPDGERGQWTDGIDPGTGERERATVVSVPIWSNGKHARARGGRDLEYAAAMGPTVGLALAKWLDNMAATAQAVAKKHAAAAAEDAHWMAPALAVARAINTPTA